MTHLLISGGLLFFSGIIVGVSLVRYGIGIGNKLTLSRENDSPIDEEIIPFNQESTE